jgi:hypothetical protein
VSLVLNGTSQYAVGPDVWPTALGSVFVGIAPTITLASATTFTLWDATGGEDDRNVYYKHAASGFQKYIDGRGEAYAAMDEWADAGVWRWVLARWNRSADAMLMDISDYTFPAPEAKTGSWRETAPATFPFYVGALRDGTVKFAGKMAWISLYDVSLSDASRDLLFGGAHPSTVAGWVDTWPLTSDANALNGNDPLTLEGSPDFDSEDDPTVSSAPSGGGNHLAGADSVALI